MKSYKHLYEKAQMEEVRRTAVHIVCLKRKDYKQCKEYTKDEEQTVKLCEEWLEHYKNDNHKPKVIYDGIKHKKRTILVPTFKELVVQHCIMQPLIPVFMHGMYEHSYASIPNRGAHKGKKVIEKFIRKPNNKKCKYVLKMDIRKYFENIDHDILKSMLNKKIHDNKMLEILFEIIDVNDKGLPLGFYTSQWLANWYLQSLDHYIKEDLGADLYIRYMDDMVVFGANKKGLHRIRNKIDKYLNEILHLEMKDNWQIYLFHYIDKNGNEHGRDLDFMGFRFYRNRTTLRKSIMTNASRKAKRLSKKDKPSIYECRQMLSYLGWIKCTDVYGMYLKYIKPYVDFGKLKERISRYDRRRAKEALA